MKHLQGGVCWQSPVAAQSLKCVVAAWRWLELEPAGGGGGERRPRAGQVEAFHPTWAGRRVAPVVQTDTRPSSSPAPPGEAAAPECGMCPVLLLLLLLLLPLLLLLHLLLLPLLLLLLLPEFLAALSHTRALHPRNCGIDPWGQIANAHKCVGRRIKSHDFETVQA